MFQGFSKCLDVQLHLFQTPHIVAMLSHIKTPGICQWEPIAEVATVAVLLRCCCLSFSSRPCLSILRLEAIASSLEAIASRNKKLLGAPGIATKSKDATRGSWPYY